MVTNLVNINYEFCEVLNAFPILKDTLKNLDLNISDVCDGESILDYFLKKSMSKEEIEFLVRKMNQSVNNLFRNNRDLISDISKSSIDIGLENIDPIISQGEE